MIAEFLTIIVLLANFLLDSNCAATIDSSVSSINQVGENSVSSLEWLAQKENKSHNESHYIKERNYYDNEYTTDYPQVVTRYAVNMSTSSILSSEVEECPSLEGNMDGYTQTTFLSKLLHPCRYDSLTMPTSDEPLDIYVQVDINHIEAEEGFLFKLQMKMTFRYNDNRLDYHNISPNRGSILGEEALIEKIWTPHLYIPNEKTSTIMGFDKKDVFMTIDPYGNIVLSQRMSYSVYCFMDLKKFPFDEQSCRIYFQTWTYNASKLIFKWDKEIPVILADQLHLTEFSWLGYDIYEVVNRSSLSHGNYHIGNHSALVFKFKVAREIGYYLLDYFIPSMLLVITSWVTFWLQADATPARTTLGTATMLTFITLAVGQSKNLPKVSYITASEIWFLGCVAFIFLSLVEFAFSNVIWRRKKQVELKKLKSKYILKSAITPKLARRDVLRGWNSNGSLHKSQSCSSLASSIEEINQRSITYHSNHAYKKSARSISVPSKHPHIGSPVIEEDNHNSGSIQITNVENPQSPPYTCITPQEVSIWIDKKSRIVFPCAFLIFNVFYWSFVYSL